MATGAAFLTSIGIIGIGIRGRASTAIVDFREPSGDRLTPDIGSKINFIVGRADAGRNLQDDIAWGCMNGFAEGLDGLSYDAELCALTSRVGQRDASGVFVHQIDSGAIGNVNAKAKVRFGSDKGVAVRHGIRRPLGHNPDMSAVDLIGLS